MKRLWVGICILAVILILGVTVTCYTDSIQAHMIHHIRLAEDAAQVGQWENAAGMLFRARGYWIQRQHLVASVSDHEPIEEAESLFAQLEIYLKAKDVTAFSACCAALRTTVRAIGEAHGVNWWNIL